MILLALLLTIAAVLAAASVLEVVRDDRPLRPPTSSFEDPQFLPPASRPHR